VAALDAGVNLTRNPELGAPLFVVEQVSVLNGIASAFSPACHQRLMRPVVPTTTEPGGSMVGVRQP
jgi:hypothetical protein